MATAVSPAIRRTEEARGTRWQAAWIPLAGDDRFDDIPSHQRISIPDHDPIRLVHRIKICDKWVLKNLVC